MVTPAPKLFQRWVVSNSLGIFGGLALGHVASSIWLSYQVTSNAGAAINPLGMSLVFGLAVGVIVGMTQWDVLRRYQPRLKGWVVITILGMVTGHLIMMLLGSEAIAPREDLWIAFISTMLNWTGVGVLLGFSQSLLLKRYFTQWWCWILASSIGAFFATLAIFTAMLGIALLNTGNRDLSAVALLGLVGLPLLSLLLPGLIYGLVTGLCLRTLPLVSNSSSASLEGEE